MAAGSTYTPIATTTISGGSTNVVTFSSISGYTDIVIIFNGGNTASGQSIYLQFNGDGGTNYSTTDLWGNGTSASSGRNTGLGFMRVVGRGIGVDSTLTTNAIIQVLNYSNSTTYKTVLDRSNETGGTSAGVGLWRNTAAITSITLTAESTTFLSGSTFTLYGIAAA